MATLTSVVTLAMNSVFYPDFYAREARKVFGQHKGALKCGTTAVLGSIIFHQAGDTPLL